MKTLESLQATQDDTRDAAPAVERVSPSSEPRLFAAPKQHRLIFCLLLALATLVLYNPITRAPFLNFDDTSYFVNNPHVHAGLSWKTVKWAFTTTELSDWKPITWLSHTLDAQLFGLKPEAPHTINILLHAANAVILFLILLRATGFGWRSLY